jgi:hypothetical protein
MSDEADDLSSAVECGFSGSLQRGSCIKRCLFVWFGTVIAVGTSQAWMVRCESGVDGSVRVR